MLLEHRSPIVPLTYAGIRLPRRWSHFITEPALDIFYERRLLLGVQALGVDDSLDPAAVPIAARIIVMGGNIQTCLTEWQTRIIKVHQIRPIFVDQVLTSEK